MIPHERSLVEKLAGKPFALLGVNSDSREAYDAEVEEMGVTWRSFWCGERGGAGPLVSEWHVGTWPTMYLIDCAGQIRYTQIGEGNYGRTETAIRTLLAEAVGPATETRAAS